MRDRRGLLRRVRDRVGELFAATAGSGGELELAAEHGERGAQLMTGVRDEGMLSSQRAVQASEQVVHGAREPP